MIALREEITGLAAYTLREHPSRIKLNQNENPYELPDEIKREILGRMASAKWSRYPPFVPEKQLRLLAEFTGWKEDGMLLGNGSNDLLQLLISCILERGKTVIISQPTFTLYALLARSIGATVVEIPMTDSFQFNIPELVAAARNHQAALVLLCSPNNPTGTCLSPGDLRTIVENVDAIVAVDEAYVQFSPFSLVESLRHYSNLVVLQTFSKAMGSAGLRFGYMLGAPWLIEQLRKVKLPYSVNIFTLIAMEILISRWDVIKTWIDTILTQREALRYEMDKLAGIRVYQSGANFLLFETLRRQPKDVFQGLLSEGILIRDVSSYPLLGKGLRVSVGTPEENSEFLNVLRKVI
jgi:histidinol-phosphate aminotransferase